MWLCLLEDSVCNVRDNSVMFGDWGRGDERFTAAGLLSTENKTAITASAIPSFNMLPSHSSSTSPLLRWRTITQPITRYAVEALDISSSASSDDPFI